MDARLVARRPLRDLLRHETLRREGPPTPCLGPRRVPTRVAVGGPTRVVTSPHSPAQDDPTRGHRAVVPSPFPSGTTGPSGYLHRSDPGVDVPSTTYRTGGTDRGTRSTPKVVVPENYCLLPGSGSGSGSPPSHVGLRTTSVHPGSRLPTRGDVRLSNTLQGLLRSVSRLGPPSLCSTFTHRSQSCESQLPEGRSPDRGRWDPTHDPSLNVKALDGPTSSRVGEGTGIRSSGESPVRDPRSNGVGPQDHERYGRKEGDPLYGVGRERGVGPVW